MQVHTLIFAIFSFQGYFLGSFCDENEPQQRLSAQQDPGSLGFTEPKFGQKFRLPETFRPESYNILIAPIIPMNGAVPDGFIEWSAPGSVQIVIECTTTTNKIVLNVDNVTIEESSVKVTRLDTNEVIPVASQVMDKQLNFHNITLERNLVEGVRYHLEMSFTAFIGEDNNGIYRGYYLDDEGNERWFASTLFAATWFRTMVPGFDEPHLKATFTVHVGRSPAHNSASNAPFDGEPGQPDTTGTLPPGWVWDNYKPTVKMSTYLLAFIVSDFTAESSAGDTPVRVLGPPNLISRGGGVFAAAESSSQLKFFEDLLGIEYRMPKMDNVAIPRNFSQFGAMENWGLIVYRDDRLLYYDGESTESEKYNIASIVSHETAHQWFGNLVTCQWWSDVFLNEGFATYMSYSGVQSTHPEFDSKRKFLYESVQSALILDAGRSSHPVRYEPTRELIEMGAIYDRIPYDKGASLLRMLENLLGEISFISGVQKYLASKQYGGATEDDLYQHLQEAGGDMLPPGKTVETVMKTWTEKKGYPLIRVSRASDKRIYVSQERFLSNQNFDTHLVSDDLWEVPVGIADAESPDDTMPKLWLEKDVTLKSYEVNASNWLIVNPGGYGFFRVHYETPLLNLILNQLNADHSDIAGLSRSQLISDYFTFAKEGIAQYGSALDLTKFLGKEVDHVVWMTVFTSINEIRRAVRSTSGGLSELSGYFSRRADSALELLGWMQQVNEHGVNVTLRSGLLDLACSMESTKCQQLSLQYFSNWTSNSAKNPIPVDVQSVIYCGAVAANSSVSEFIMERYKDETMKKGEFARIQASRLATSLTCSSDEKYLQTLLESIISPNSDISKEHVRTIVSGVANNVHGRGLAIDFVKSKWKELMQYSGSPQVIVQVLSDISTIQNSAEDLMDHENFIETVKSEDASSYEQIAASLKNIGDVINANVKWARRHLPAIQEWLKNNANL